MAFTSSRLPFSGKQSLSIRKLIEALWKIPIKAGRRTQHKHSRRPSVERGRNKNNLLKLSKMGRGKGEGEKSDVGCREVV